MRVAKGSTLTWASVARPSRNAAKEFSRTGLAPPEVVRPSNVVESSREVLYGLVECPITLQEQDAGGDEMTAFANGNVIADLPDLIQPVPWTDASGNGEVKTGVAERGVTIIHWVFRHTRKPDQIRNVVRRIVGAAKKFVLEKAVPSSAQLVYHGRRENMRIGHAQVLSAGPIVVGIHAKRGNRERRLSAEHVAAIQVCSYR